MLTVLLLVATSLGEPRPDAADVDTTQRPPADAAASALSPAAGRATPGLDRR